MSLNLIVAHDKNKVIGNGLNIPWDIKGEQKLFKELNIPRTNITRCCRKRGLKTAGGFIWRYSEEGE